MSPGLHRYHHLLGTSVCVGSRNLDWVCALKRLVLRAGLNRMPVPEAFHVGLARLHLCCVSALLMCRQALSLRSQCLKQVLVWSFAD
jgi:hypothetical protein